MPVVLMIEWNNPTEPERYKKSYDITVEDFEPYFENKKKDGVKWKLVDYSDGSNSLVGWHEFETIEDFSKIWGDEEFQKIFSRFSYYVDNCKVRILRPVHHLKPEQYYRKPP